MIPKTMSSRGCGETKDRLEAAVGVSSGRLIAVVGASGSTDGDSASDCGAGPVATALEAATRPKYELVHNVLGNIGGQF